MTENVDDKMDLAIAFISDLVSETDVVFRDEENADKLSTLAKIYWEESLFTLNIIRKRLPPIADKPRILEIGAGIGLVSHILAHCGYDVDAIEPSGGSFEFMEKLGVVIKKRLEDQQFRTCDLQPLSLEDMDTKLKYDFIFSSHVLEHVLDLNCCFKNLRLLSKPGASQTHLCPNYVIPYEPHLGVLLVPFLGRHNRGIYRTSYKKFGKIWDNINFITASRAKTLAAEYEFQICFDDTILQTYLERFQESGELSKRHKNMMFRVIFLTVRFLTKIVKLPGSIQSPMLMDLSPKKKN
jgi:SAM-dependent methyltransferase